MQRVQGRAKLVRWTQTKVLWCRTLRKRCKYLVVCSYFALCQYCHFSFADTVASFSIMYDSPPVYSPPYSTTSQNFFPVRSVNSPQSQYAPYTYSVPPDSYYMEGRPQHFYRWFSPPGLVKTFQGLTVLLCFLIFAFVASTLVWDMNGFGYGGYGVGSAGSVAGTGTGYYGGSYGYGGSYMTPHSAKSAMISMAAINFLVSLGFLIASFSRSRLMRGCSFYLTVFICDIILAILQVSNLYFKLIFVFKWKVADTYKIAQVYGILQHKQNSPSRLYPPCLHIHCTVTLHLYSSQLLPNLLVASHFANTNTCRLNTRLFTERHRVATYGKCVRRIDFFFHL